MVLATSILLAASTSSAQQVEAWRVIAPRARVHESSVSRDGATTTVWAYLPQAPQRGPLPVVLIAPAGAAIPFGSSLSEEDRAEHIPYVEAGFAVVAYSVTGAVSDGAPAARQIAAMDAFIRSRGGVADAQRALDHALGLVPSLDRDCVFAAGHSSAGSVALRVAAAMPGIRGVAAYAAVSDPLRMPEVSAAALPARLRRFYQGEGSPLATASRWRTPTFLMHADDDSVVPVEQTLRFRAALPPDLRVEVVRVPEGDHYRPMLETGIPQAIRFFRSLCPGSSSPTRVP
jgi:dipeptidyl aminopeptidase/acylaminoacyl peptidase